MKERKAPGAKPNKNLIAGIIMLAVIIFMYFFNEQNKAQHNREEQIRQTTQLAKMEDNRRKGLAKALAKVSSAQMNPGNQKDTSKKSESAKNKDLLNELNQEAIDSFSKTTGLQIPAIPGMNFSNYDFDDNIGAIIGKDSVRGLELGLFAKQGIVNEGQLKEYLASDTSGIPGLQGMSGVQLGEAQPLNAIQGSGLAQGKVWQVQNGDRNVYIALIPRQDGQGTYFASVSSSSLHLENAEDFYESIYNNLKVSR